MLPIAAAGLKQFVGDRQGGQDRRLVRFDQRQHVPDPPERGVDVGRHLPGVLGGQLGADGVVLAADRDPDRVLGCRHDAGSPASCSRKPAGRPASAPAPWRPRPAAAAPDSPAPVRSPAAAPGSARGPASTPPLALASCSSASALSDRRRHAASSSPTFWQEISQLVRAHGRQVVRSFTSSSFSTSAAAFEAHGASTSASRRVRSGRAKHQMKRHAPPPVRGIRAAIFVEDRDRFQQRPRRLRMHRRHHLRAGYSRWKQQREIPFGRRTGGQRQDRGRSGGARHLLRAPNPKTGAAQGGTSNPPSDQPGHPPALRARAQPILLYQLARRVRNRQSDGRLEERFQVPQVVVRRLAPPRPVRGHPSARDRLPATRRSSWGRSPGPASRNTVPISNSRMSRTAGPTSWPAPPDSSPGSRLAAGIPLPPTSGLTSGTLSSSSLGPSGKVCAS